MDFAGSLRTLAAARRRQDPVWLHAALIDVAAAALAWAGMVGSASRGELRVVSAQRTLTVRGASTF